MKKTFRNFFAAMSVLMVAAFAFTSCNDGTNPDDPDKDKDKESKVEYNAIGGNFGADENGIYEIIIELDDKNVTIDDQGNITGGNGNIISMYFVASACDENLFPAKGKYEVKEATQTLPTPPALLAGLDQQGQIGGSLVAVVEDGVATTKKVLSGSIDFSASGTEVSISGTLKLEDGTDVKVEYNGVVDMMDANPYSMESKTPTTKNITATECEVLKQAAQGGDLYVLGLYSDAGDQFVSMFGVEEGQEDIKGQYPLAPGLYLDAAVASSGVQNGAPTPTLLVCADQSVFFLTDGTLEIADKKITFSGKSYYGSTVTVTYEGEWTVTDASQSGAPERIMNTKSANRFVKVSL